jgi:hypothetical protein
MILLQRARAVKTRITKGEKKKKKPRQNPNEFVPKAIFSAYHSSMTVIPISFYCSKPQGGADRPCHAATREGPG